MVYFGYYYYNIETDIKCIVLEMPGIQGQNSPVDTVIWEINEKNLVRFTSEEEIEVFINH